jgi:hypothetical protein
LCPPPINSYCRRMLIQKTFRALKLTPVVVVAICLFSLFEWANAVSTIPNPSKAPGKTYSGPLSLSVPKPVPKLPCSPSNQAVLLFSPELKNRDRVVAFQHDDNQPVQRKFDLISSNCDLSNGESVPAFASFGPIARPFARAQLDKVVSASNKISVTLTVQRNGLDAGKGFLVVSIGSSGGTIFPTAVAFDVSAEKKPGFIVPRPIKALGLLFLLFIVGSWALARLLSDSSLLRLYESLRSAPTMRERLFGYVLLVVSERVRRRPVEH